MLCKAECQKGAAAGAGKEGGPPDPSEGLQVAGSSCRAYTSADRKELLPVEITLFSEVNRKQNSSFLAYAAPPAREEPYSTVGAVTT